MSWSREEQVAVYGVTEQQIDAEVERWKTSPFAFGNGSPKALAFSILSDVQELIAVQTPTSLESARQKINVVKYILTQHVAEADGPNAWRSQQ